jgi:hypothetical protein
MRSPTLALGALLLIGCYTLRPTRGTTPAIGAQVAFDVNDAGRVGLGPIMGSEIVQVEGRLVSKDSAEYVLAVTAVRTMRGGEQVWSGEEVRIKSEYVGPPYERRFDTTRSVAVGGTVVGGFAAFLIGRALVGAGSGGSGKNTGETAAAHRGRPRAPITP